MGILKDNFKREKRNIGVKMRIGNGNVDFNMQDGKWCIKLRIGTGNNDFECRIGNSVQDGNLDWER